MVGVHRCKRDKSSHTSLESKTRKKRKRGEERKEEGEERGRRGGKDSVCNDLDFAFVLQVDLAEACLERFDS